uniref:C6H2-type domain-containing protein n=1 Tax=Piliocolobus tephrosceles TaxID=591936 RepID=A0A8C9GQ39_9PRIM
MISTEGTNTKDGRNNSAASSSTNPENIGTSHELNKNSNNCENNERHNAIIKNVSKDNEKREFEYDNNNNSCISTTIHNNNNNILNHENKIINMVNSSHQIVGVSTEGKNKEVHKNEIVQREMHISTHKKGGESIQGDIQKSVQNNTQGKEQKNVKNTTPIKILCSGCKEPVNKKLSCPICLSNKINSYFCSQVCFKQNWVEHVKIHKVMVNEDKQEKSDIKNEDKTSNKMNNDKDTNANVDGITSLEIIQRRLDPKNFDCNDTTYWVFDEHMKNFINFHFTGNLKKWPISKINTVPDHIDKPDYALTSIPQSELVYKKKSDIYVNNPTEIERIKEACILGRKTLDHAHKFVAPGVTTDFIDKKVHEFIIQNNAYPSTLNYYKFPKSCCTSVNEVICHGIPDYRPLEKGDILNIDISVYYKGMHADLNETYFVGGIENATEDAKELVKT